MTPRPSRVHDALYMRFHIFHIEMVASCDQEPHCLHLGVNRLVFDSASPEFARKPSLGLQHAHGARAMHLRYAFIYSALG